MSKIELSRSDLLRELIAVAAAFLLAILTWYLWYPMAGYTPLTVTVAQISVPALAGRLGLNLASWLVFGTVYLLSGNLWLVVLAHAATDYGVTPLITNEPVFGLVFMAILIAGASRIGHRAQTNDGHRRRSKMIVPGARILRGPACARGDS